MNLNDKLLSEALADMRNSRNRHWQLRVLAEMARQKRRRRFRTVAVAASIAAAFMLPLIFKYQSESIPYIYTPEYYASLPRHNLSIPDEINAIIGNPENSQSYFEPYEPLPQ